MSPSVIGIADVQELSVSCIKGKYYTVKTTQQCKVRLSTTWTSNIKILVICHYLDICHNGIQHIN